MKLVGADGAYVALDIVRYEFPSMSSSVDDDWDANWLVIRGEAFDGDRRWGFSDPCLTTWEARELTAWLRAVAGRRIQPRPLGEDGDGGLTFTEPNLGLSLHSADANAASLRVHFSLESAPPWIDEEGRYDMYEFFLELTVPVHAIESAASEWESALSAFPAR
jgi:hypothetical protein